MSTTTSQDAPDPRRFAGLSLADAIDLIVAEGQAEIAAEADAEATETSAWLGD